jgi:hypothetical protein
MFESSRKRVSSWNSFTISYEISFTRLPLGTISGASRFPSQDTSWSCSWISSMLTSLPLPLARIFFPIWATTILFLATVIEVVISYFFRVSHKVIFIQFGSNHISHYISNISFITPHLEKKHTWSFTKSNLMWYLLNGLRWNSIQYEHCCF